VISSVAKVPCARGQKYFTPSPTKTAVFEVKNRRKSAKIAKAEHLLFDTDTSVYFWNKIRFTVENAQSPFAEGQGVFEGGPPKLRRFYSFFRKYTHF